MQVCQDWHAIMLSIPGLHSQLTIRRATQREEVQTFIQGRKTRLGVVVDMNDEGDGSHFDAKNFHACFMAAVGAASRWSSLNLISPPPHGEYKDLQILQALMHLESLKLACGSGEFFEQLTAEISRNAPPNLTTMVLADPAAVLRLTQPAFAHIYHSLTTLKVQLFKRMDRTVDILPHLQRLETLEACRLCLPSYSPDSPLPLIHTLRFLYLKSVSIQWMAGRAFPSLERCCVIFPTLHASQPVTMMSCSFLLYHSNDLHPLTQFHLPSLDTLDVKNAQWNVWRGNPQLAGLRRILAATPQCLTLLRLDVQCSEWLLVYMLKLAPVLQELWLGLAYPDALSKAFFQAFIVRKPNADGVSAMVGPSTQTIAPLCPSLKLLHLHYRRWMRSPDKRSLVVAFGEIVGSRQLETESSFSLSLSFDEAHEESHWTVSKPVRKIHDLEGVGLILGILTPHATIPVSTLLPERGLVSIPFKKAESLHLFARDSTSMEFSFIRDHMELMVYDRNQPPPPPPSLLLCALPLFAALRVLVMKCDDPSFLAGHTFHKLERCRLLKKGRFKHSLSERVLTETGLPVCTRVDIDDPWMLAAFKLPQIHELASDFLDENRGVIWEKHIAVNANLSGLNLLHLKNWPHHGNLIPILRSVPLLETLIITTSVKMVINNVWAEVALLRAFLPIDANRTSELKQTSGEGKVLGVLCPKLRHLQVESEYCWVGLDLEPIAKAIVTLRAECGSPLKVLTVSQNFSEPRKQFKIIERDGSVTMEEIVLPENSKRFALDI